MKKMIKLTRRGFCLCFLLFMTGCATMQPISQSVIDNADYGEYPTQYEEIVKGYFAHILKDPYSAVYRFDKPYKAYLREAPVSGGAPRVFGYIVEVGVNAKNSFGGYVGEKYYRLFIRNGQIQGDVHSTQFFSEHWYR